MRLGQEWGPGRYGVLLPRDIGVSQVDLHLSGVVASVEEGNRMEPLGSCSSNFGARNIYDSNIYDRFYTIENPMYHIYQL